MAVKARLAGHPFDLEALERLLGEGADPEISHDAEGYYLTSPELEPLFADGGTLFEVASRLLRRANGIARASDPTFRPVSLARRFENGDRSHVVAAAETAEAREQALPITAVIDGRPQEHPSSPGLRYAALATKHPDVAEALRILGGSVNYSWDDLHKVYEIVRANVGGTGNKGTDEQRLRDKEWLTLSEHHGFRNSANTKSISGDAARHATGEQPTTPDTMPLEQGREVISRLVRKWLDSLP